MEAFLKTTVGSVLLAMALVVATCSERHHEPLGDEVDSTVQPVETTSVEQAPDFFTDASEGTRLALVEPCGRCHQSTLVTHKKGAIAVFDLDLGDRWHMELEQEHLEGILSRTQNNKAISKEELAQIKHFLNEKGTLLE